MFRSDLYYRLEEYPLFIPSLRERKEDIPMLANHFLESFCTANNIEPLTFNKSVLDQLSEYDWPGNIRELQNIVRRAAINRSGNEIISVPLLSQSSRQDQPSQKAHSPENTPEKQSTLPEKTPHSSLPSDSGLPEQNDEKKLLLKSAELQAIIKAYTLTGGNQTRTAEVLGISRSSLYRKLKKYGIEKNLSISVTKEL